MAKRMTANQRNELTDAAVDLERHPGFLAKISSKAECEATRMVDTALTEEGWLVKANIGNMIGRTGWPDRTYIPPVDGIVIWAEWKGVNATVVSPHQKMILEKLAVRRQFAVVLYICEDHRIELRCAGGARREQGWGIDLLKVEKIGSALLLAVRAECARWWSARGLVQLPPAPGQNS